MVRLRRPLAPFAAALLLAGVGAVPAAPVAPAAAATGSPPLTAIDVSSSTACALVAGGTIRCWGANASGILGNGSTRNSIVPVTVSGITTATRVSVGSASACAVLASGRVRCWGEGGYGRLGTGSTADASTPVTVSGITTAVDVQVGSTHACALLAGGGIRCWGDNRFGQLGDGTTTKRLMPVSVSGISTATGLSAGSNFSCARLASGAARCWGNNADAQLGDGTLTTRKTPVAVSGITDAVDVSAGGYHACATRANGEIRCWGTSEDGVIGDGSVDRIRRTPVAVTGITNAIDVEAGFDQTCARLANGTTSCWGDNFFGQLGDGTNLESYVPVAVSGPLEAVALSSGLLTVCAVLPDATGRCWGNNQQGQLGDRTLVNRSVPTPISWDPDAVAPVAVAPVVELEAGRQTTQGVITARVSWSAGDGAGGTGIDHYQVQKSRDGGATWTTLPVTKSRTYLASLGASGTVRYRVRAWDRAANVSAWATGPVVSPRLVQDTSSLVVRTGSWSRVTGTDYLGGSLRATTAASATATYRFTGTSVAYVAALGTSRGSVQVWVDGVLDATVSLNGPTARRWVAWSKSWPAPGTHTVRLVAEATPGTPRVDLDAFEVVK